MQESKRDVVLLDLLRKDLDDTLEQRTAGAMAERTIKKQPKVQRRELKELGSGLRIGNMKPTIRMICTMKP